jgi:hypothetical protein
LIILLKIRLKKGGKLMLILTNIIISIICIIIIISSINHLLNELKVSNNIFVLPEMLIKMLKVKLR